MQQHIQRMIDEHNELNTKTNACSDFVFSLKFESLPLGQQALLKMQMHAMRCYLEILSLRIETGKQS